MIFNWPTIASASLVLPYLSILIGQNLGAEVIDSSSIFNNSLRQLGAFISFGFAVIASAHYSSGLPEFFRQGRSFIPMAYSIFLCLLLGILASNSTTYILSDLYKYISMIAFFYLGFTIGKNEHTVNKILKQFVYVGGAIVLYELSLSIATGTFLPVRYGTGIANIWICFSLPYFFNSKKYFSGIASSTIGLVSVVGSSSRILIILYALLMLIFFFHMNKKYTIAAAVLIALSAFSLYSLIPGVNQAVDTLLYRFSIIGDLSNYFSSVAINTGMDASIYGRVLEARSVLESVQNWLIGNGLGATFSNSRGEILTGALSATVNDHYIHTTILSLLLHGGVVLLLCVLNIFYRLFLLVLHSKSSHKLWYLIVLMLAANVALKFPISSGAYYSVLPLLMFAFGVLKSKYQLTKTSSPTPLNK